MDPLVFQPLCMQRVWGGRTLESLYGKVLEEAGQPYGESWEIVDREVEQSLVLGGKYAGKSLGQLWQDHRAEIFGDDLKGDRFPLLVKILDARDDLSIQVHPPADVAPGLGGEPKTEMWYIAAADPGAKLYIGVKEGVSRSDFEIALADGTVADCVHVIEPKAGDSIFIPSGRLHAIGAGLLIYEIQQNSDTTYRVFDWNRVGLDGVPRDLHIEESMACIDFTDVEPTMDELNSSTIASCEHFQVDRYSLVTGEIMNLASPESFEIVAVVEGLAELDGGVVLQSGKFALVPRGGSTLKCLADTVILTARL